MVGLAAVPVGCGGAWPDNEPSAPSEARGADGSWAGRRPRARQAAQPHSKTRRRPEHPWGPQQHRNSGGTPREQRRQVEAPAARQLRGLGAAGEAVRQVHRIGLR